MSGTYKISILPMNMTVIDEETGETRSSKQDDWYIFPDEVRESLTPILARHGYAQTLDEHPNADWLLAKIEDQCRDTLRKKPWVIVFFPDEYAISGHIISKRSDPNLIKAPDYASVRPGAAGFDPSTGIAPRVGMLWIFSKQALEDSAASGSELFGNLLAELSTLDEKESWCHFADAPDRQWLANQAVTDNELFFSFFGK